MSRHALLVAFTLAAFAQTASDVEITAELHHHQVFSNDQVRVFNVEVAPGSPTLMHWHRHDYIYVTLGDTELSNEVEGKPPVDVKLRDGETRFSPGPFAHLIRNLSAQPFRNVTIEILQDEKLRQSPAHWDEDRGLTVLQGGTKEILFVKDGIRVSEFELQPGGVVPKHHHTGPVLLVAVNDLDLRNDVEAKPPEPIHFKSGDSKWFPANYTHAVTNAGHNQAKFVTLEFP